MSTPTTETLNGGSTMKVPTQTTADPNVAAEGQTLKPGTVGVDNTTSGMNIGGASVSPTVIRNVDARTLQGSHAGSVPAPNTGAGITDAFKTQAGPRGETDDQLEGVGG